MRRIAASLGSPSGAAGFGHHGAGRWWRELALLALFVALACIHSWPLATAPGTWCRNDTGDPILNEWALAWVAHQIVTDPLHLFDANIFYPSGTRWRTRAHAAAGAHGRAGALARRIARAGS